MNEPIQNEPQNVTEMPGIQRPPAMTPEIMDATIEMMEKTVRFNRLMIHTGFQQSYAAAMNQDKASLDSISVSFQKWREAEGIYELLGGSNATACCEPRRGFFARLFRR